jgi:hypothetical protein
MGTPEEERDAADREIQSAINSARAVARGAQRDFGDFASMHEAYGVLAEEVAEFLDAVRLRQTNPNRVVKCELEAIDIAAVALRIAAQAKRVTR